MQWREGALWELKVNCQKSSIFLKTLLTKEDLHVSAKVSFSSEDLVIASVHS